MSWLSRLWLPNFHPSPSPIAKRRAELIRTRQARVRAHARVADIDAELQRVTTAQLRAESRRLSLYGLKLRARTVTRAAGPLLEVRT